MYYTGVGSRKTPNNILGLMTAIAAKMNSYGYILRSGGAEGADRAFESAAGNNKEIFYADQATSEAKWIASKFHPVWHKCSSFAKKLHGRNSFQVLGINLDTPSAYCICWTPDGCNSHKNRSIKTGGTGTAISIAEHYGVPIVNLADPHMEKMWSDWVNK